MKKIKSGEEPQKKPPDKKYDFPENPNAEIIELVKEDKPEEMLEIDIAELFEMKTIKKNIELQVMGKTFQKIQEAKDMCAKILEKTLRRFSTSMKINWEDPNLSYYEEAYDDFEAWLFGICTSCYYKGLFRTHMILTKALNSTNSVYNDIRTMENKAEMESYKFNQYCWELIQKEALARCLYIVTKLLYYVVWKKQEFLAEQNTRLHYYTAHFPQHELIDWQSEDMIPIDVALKAVVIKAVKTWYRVQGIRIFLKGESPADDRPIPGRTMEDVAQIPFRWQETSCSSDSYSDFEVLPSTLCRPPARKPMKENLPLIRSNTAYVDARTIITRKPRRYKEPIPKPNCDNKRPGRTQRRENWLHMENIQESSNNCGENLMQFEDGGCRLVNTIEGIEYEQLFPRMDMRSKKMILNDNDWHEELMSRRGGWSDQEASSTNLFFDLPYPKVDFGFELKIPTEEVCCHPEISRAQDEFQKEIQKQDEYVQPITIEVRNSEPVLGEIQHNSQGNSKEGRQHVQSMTTEVQSYDTSIAREVPQHKQGISNEVPRYGQSIPSVNSRFEHNIQQPDRQPDIFVARPSCRFKKNSTKQYCRTDELRPKYECPVEKNIRIRNSKLEPFGMNDYQYERNILKEVQDWEHELPILNEGGRPDLPITNAVHQNHQQTWKDARQHDQSMPRGVQRISENRRHNQQMQSEVPEQSQTISKEDQRHDQALCRVVRQQDQIIKKTDQRYDQRYDQHYDQQYDQHYDQQYDQLITKRFQQYDQQAPRDDLSNEERIYNEDSQIDQSQIKTCRLEEGIPRQVHQTEQEVRVPREKYLRDEKIRKREHQIDPPVPRPDPRQESKVNRKVQRKDRGYDQLCVNEYDQLCVNEYDQLYVNEYDQPMRKQECRYDRPIREQDYDYDEAILKQDFRLQQKIPREDSPYHQQFRSPDRRYDYPIHEQSCRLEENIRAQHLRHGDNSFPINRRSKRAQQMSREDSCEEPIPIRPCSRRRDQTKLTEKADLTTRFKLPAFLDKPIRKQDWRILTPDSLSCFSTQSTQKQEWKPLSPDNMTDTSNNNTCTASPIVSDFPPSRTNSLCLRSSSSSTSVRTSSLTENSFSTQLSQTSFSKSSLHSRSSSIPSRFTLARLPTPPDFRALPYSFVFDPPILPPPTQFRMEDMSSPESFANSPLEDEEELDTTCNQYKKEQNLMNNNCEEYLPKPYPFRRNESLPINVCPKIRHRPRMDINKLRNSVDIYPSPNDKGNANLPKQRLRRILTRLEAAAQAQRVEEGNTFQRTRISNHIVEPKYPAGGNAIRMALQPPMPRELTELRQVASTTRFQFFYDPTQTDSINSIRYPVPPPAPAPSGRSIIASTKVNKKGGQIIPSTKRKIPAQIPQGEPMWGRPVHIAPAKRPIVPTRLMKSLPTGPPHTNLVKKKQLPEHLLFGNFKIRHREEKPTNVATKPLRLTKKQLLPLLPRK